MTGHGASMLRVDASRRVCESPRPFVSTWRVRCASCWWLCRCCRLSQRAKALPEGARAAITMGVGVNAWR
jgi:hypothetical protein